MMRMNQIAGLAAVVLTCGCAGQQDSAGETGQEVPRSGVTYTFDGDAPGQPPADWIAGVTGGRKGAAPRWDVLAEEGGNVLAQLEPGGERSDFPVCLRQGSSFQDGTVRVLLKPISGEVDQAGGVVFRAQDTDNFYVARANALENNVSIYYTRDGQRTTMKYWEDFEVQLGEWHELAVEARGFTFKVWLNDELVGEVVDPDQVFPDAGMVGVWTKADSVTHFKELSIDAR